MADLPSRPEHRSYPDRAELPHGSTPQHRHQSALPRPHPTRPSPPTEHRVQLDPIRTPHYVDRDDPARHTDVRPSRRSEPRRRSRSPDSSARHAASSAVPWVDQRLPRTDHTPSHKAAATSRAASSKPSIPRPAATAATKRMATDITKWNRKQAELHDDEPASTADPDPTQMSEAALASYDYKDATRIACLLCQRKFKSADTLLRHEAESQLHKDNLASVETCRQGVARKLEGLAEASAAADSATAAPSVQQYRDRASERRAVFGTEPPLSSSTAGGGKVFEGPRAVAAEAVRSAPERPIDGDNIGSKLLRMMGWTQGQGLGSQRQGTTEIVQTKIYRPGAGLGSAVPVPTAEAAGSIGQTAGGKSIAFQGYAERAKDRKCPPQPRPRHHASP